MSLISDLRVVCASLPQAQQTAASTARMLYYIQLVSFFRVTGAQPHPQGRWIEMHSDEAGDPGDIALILLLGSPPRAVTPRRQLAGEVSSSLVSAVPCCRQAVRA